MIHYTPLEQILQDLETKVLPARRMFPSAFEVRDNGKSTVQGFVLDDSTSDQELPVVIAVGANYTQNNEFTPRDVIGSGDVRAKLKSWRTWLDRGFADYRKNPSLWVKRCAAPSLSLPVPPPGKYHLVMTNFCLWITRRNWSAIQAQIRADLLQNNAHFAVRPSVAPDWPHLQDLHNKLPDSLWVGHGSRTEVFTLFRQFVDKQNNTPWLLTPNVSFHYDYGKWAFLRDD
jgi:hypothetical protein